MDTLVSLRDSYKDFCDKYSLKFKKKGPALKAGTIYGSHYGEPLEEKLSVFVLDAISDDANRILTLLERIQGDEKYKDYKIRIIVNTKLQAESLAWIKCGKILLSTDKETYEAYATAGCIVTEGYLPEYFVKREGQKVLCIFSDQLGKQVAACREEIHNEDVQRTIIRLLKTTDIVTDNSTQVQYLMDFYNIKNIYKGEILLLSEAKDRDGKMLPEYYKKVLSLIFDWEKQEKQSVQCLPEKISVFIYASWNSGFNKYIKRFVNNFDYDKYDITLFIKEPKNNLEKQRLKSINKNVRVLYRKGTFSCADKEYVDLLYLIDNLNAFEDMDQALQMLNRELLKREYRRICGDVSFDRFIYIGGYDNIWSALSLVIPAEKKILFELRKLAKLKSLSITPAQSKAFENMLDLYGQIFDNIVFPTEEARNASLDEKFYEREKCSVFSYPCGVSKKPADTYFKIITYKEKEYGVCEAYDLPFKQIHLQMIPLPEKGGTSYIADGDISDTEKLLPGFAKIIQKQENAKLFIYGGNITFIRQIAEKYDLEDRVTAINKVCLENLSCMEEYLQNFVAFLTTDEDDLYCPIRVAMEVMDKDVFRISYGKIEKMDTKLFDSIKEHELYTAEKYEALLK